jgi:hypothetical protein
MVNYFYYKVQHNHYNKANWSTLELLLGSSSNIVKT